MKKHIILVAGAAMVLSGCNALRPKQTPVDVAFTEIMQRPKIETDVIIKPSARPAAGSLWRPGAKQFFKDSRAHAVGDIITIIVSENTEAETEATTETTRTHDNTSGVTNLLALGGKLTARGIPLGPTGLTDTESNRTFTGEGKTDRKDKLTGKIAAVVTQVLPNGYLVVQGKREVVVNYEMQEMGIQGIVRPEDITSNNTIASDKVAEARLFYAGRGTVDETQTPTYGVRFLDKVMPF